MKLKLIDDCTGIWKHYSTIALEIAAGLYPMWAALPESVRASMPGWMPQAVAWITTAVAFGGLVGKFVDQPGVGPFPPASIAPPAGDEARP